MRYPQAGWRPTSKHGYYGLGDICLGLGVVMHSMEGDLATALEMLDDHSLAKSWHFSVAADGAVLQHIDTAEISWASGGFGANQRFWSIEHEGRAGEPLTDAQYAASAALVGWLLGMHSLTPARSATGGTLWEHNELTVFGSAPTACPSGRIPWDRLLSEIEGGLEVTYAQAERIIQLLEALVQVQAGDTDPRTPEWENAFEQRRKMIALLERALAKPG